MLRVVDFRTGTLPPTATYARRSWCWVPADRAHPEWDRRLGNLTVKLQHSRAGAGRAVEVDTYAVEECDPLPGRMGRVFLLVNVSDPGQEQPYEVVIGPAPVCTCTAGKCRVAPDPGRSDGCKHRDALALLVESGVLDELDDHAGAGAVYEDRPGEPTAAEL